MALWRSQRLDQNLDSNSANYFGYTEGAGFISMKHFGLSVIIDRQSNLKRSFEADGQCLHANPNDLVIGISIVIDNDHSE